MSSTGVYPAQLDDCRTAVGWLRSNGSRFGIDPQRISVCGESASSHLAALVGNVESAPRTRAVCALYPPTNLLTLGRIFAKPDRLSNIDKLAGGPTEQRLALAAEEGPVNNVGPSSPPFLFTGTRFRMRSYFSAQIPSRPEFPVAGQNLFLRSPRASPVRNHTV